MIGGPIAGTRVRDSAPQTTPPRIHRENPTLEHGKEYPRSAAASAALSWVTMQGRDTGWAQTPSSLWKTHLIYSFMVSKNIPLPTKAVALKCRDALKASL